MTIREDGVKVKQRDLQILKKRIQLYLIHIQLTTKHFLNDVIPVLGIRKLLKITLILNPNFPILFILFHQTRISEMNMLPKNNFLILFILCRPIHNPSSQVLLRNPSHQICQQFHHPHIRVHQVQPICLTLIPELPVHTLHILKGHHRLAPNDGY